MSDDTGIDRLKKANEYMRGALQIVVAKSRDQDMSAVAQAALDLAEHGEEACAAMRGDDDL